MTTQPPDRMPQIPSSVRVCRRCFVGPAIVFLAALVTSCQLLAQALPDSGTMARPAILGTLESGKYSNPMIGFELQLDPQCDFQDEARDIQFSRNFSQRLILTLNCGQDMLLLSSFPLHADDYSNLKQNAQVSLEGTMAGGGFQKRGRWKQGAVGGAKVLVQELTATTDAGPQAGFYYAMLIGRRYLSVLTMGPEADRAQLGEFLLKMNIKTSAQRPAI